MSLARERFLIACKNIRCMLRNLSGLNLEFHLRYRGLGRCVHGDARGTIHHCRYVYRVSVFHELMLARLLFKVMSLGKAAIEDVAGPIGARGEEMKSQFLTRLFRETRS